MIDAIALSTEHLQGDRRQGSDDGMIDASALSTEHLQDDRRQGPVDGALAG